MKIAPHCALSICMCLSALAADQPTYYAAKSFYDYTNRTHHLLYCGYHEHKMAFVVMQSWGEVPPKTSPHINLKLKDDPTQAGVTYVLRGWIKMPDGTKQNLISSRTAFEYTNGVYRASLPIDITDDQFSRYLRSAYESSMSATFTVDGLKKFMEEEKAKSSNKRVEPTADDAVGSASRAAPRAGGGSP